MQKIIRSQIKLSKKFDRLLSAEMTNDGLDDFIKDLVPEHLTVGKKVYDIGGGKNPFIKPKRKKKIRAYIVGIDIDKEELVNAPKGAYDETIVSDIAKYKGDESGDLVICQTLLEHVSDVDAAFAAMNSALKSGGKALVYLPSRNAVFARINMVMPEVIKKKLLYSIFPGTQELQGFPAYYDKCTPRQFKKLAQKHNFICKEQRLFYFSNYFMFFFPLFFVWRIWMLSFKAISKEASAEAFSMVLEKQTNPEV